MTTADLLLLSHADRRLHVVPVRSLQSLVIFNVGGKVHDRAKVPCTALQSDQVVHVDRRDLWPHVVPDDSVSATLSRFSATGLRSADSPMLSDDRQNLPMFGNLADPTWLSISLGGQCDSSCTFCFTEWIRHEPKLSHGQALRALDEAASIGTVESVVFSGGEPTLRNCLADLVRHASAQGFNSIGLQTNGHRLANSEYLKGLTESGLTDVLLSLHGAVPETHNRITRHRNSFALALRALTLLAQEEGISTEVNFVVCTQNADEADAFTDLVHQTAPRASIRYSFPVVEGAAYDNMGSTLPTLQIFVERVSAALMRAAGTVPISAANVPPCISSAVGLPPSYTRSQRRSMLGVSPFVSSATPRGEVSAKLQVCDGCAFADECDGLQLPYLQHFPLAYQHVAQARGAIDGTERGTELGSRNGGSLRTVSGTDPLHDEAPRRLGADP